MWKHKLQIPEGQYYESNGFAFILSVLLRNLQKYQLIIEFLSESSSISLSFNKKSDNFELLVRLDDNMKNCMTNVTLKKEVWYIVAVTSNFTKHSLYLNNRIQCSFEYDVSNEFTNKTQKESFIGKAIDGSNPFHGILRHLKVFNQNLNANQIKSTMYKNINDQVLFIQKSTDFNSGLVHYWPFAGSTRDVIGGKHMKIVKRAKLFNDRFGNFQSGKKIYKLFLWLTAQILGSITIL